MTYIVARDTKDDDRKRRVDEELDEALKETFPASDPIEPPEPEESQAEGHFSSPTVRRIEV